MRGVALALCLLTAGCAATALQGAVRIDPSPVAGASHRVSFLNVSDIHYDGDVFEDRQRITKELLRSDGCPQPSMIGSETPLRMGTWLFGTPRVSYVSDWRCG